MVMVEGLLAADGLDLCEMVNVIKLRDGCQDVL